MFSSPSTDDAHGEAGYSPACPTAGWAAAVPTPSKLPGCWGCGVVLGLNFQRLLNRPPLTVSFPSLSPQGLNPSGHAFFDSHIFSSLSSLQNSKCPYCYTSETAVESVHSSIQQTVSSPCFVPGAVLPVAKWSSPSASGTGTQGNGSPAPVSRPHRRWLA